MQGDDMLFVREDAVEAACQLSTQYLITSPRCTFMSPDPGGRPKTDQFAAAIGGWHNRSYAITGVEKRLIPTRRRRRWGGRCLE